MAQGSKASRRRCQPLSAPGSGQVGARSKDTPRRPGVADTPWGPSSSTAKPPLWGTEAIQLIAGTSQRACSRGVMAWAGRSITPPVVSAAHRWAGCCRGISKRNNSWRARQSTLSTSSNQGLAARRRPSSRTGLEPQRPRHTKLVQRGPCSAHWMAPSQRQARGCSA